MSSGARVPVGVSLAAWLLRLSVLPFALAIGLLVPALPVLLLVVASSVEPPMRYGHFAILITGAVMLVATALVLARLWLVAELLEVSHAGARSEARRMSGWLRRNWRRDALECAVLAGLVLVLALALGSLAGARLLRQPWLLAEAGAWALPLWPTAAVIGRWRRRESGHSQDPATPVAAGAGSRV